MAGQAVVGDGLPGRGVRDVLAVRRPDAGVGVESAHPDADRVVVVGVAAEEGGPAGGAEGLLEAVGGRVDGHELLSARDVERAGRGAGADRGGAAGAALAAGAVAVAGVLGRGRELVADTPAHAAPGEGEGHAARVPRAGARAARGWQRRLPLGLRGKPRRTGARSPWLPSSPPHGGTGRARGSTSRAPGRTRAFRGGRGGRSRNG